ncbi:MAG: NAD(P)H-hydrate dehydratase, partial [Candidatus Riflebacteria bacterium]|nr:NAD(P)H-hydrate dehydratase [Candidatus Riflebacteria bacterium]
DNVSANQVSVAREFAIENRVVVVLKSAVTVIAEPGGMVYVSSRPNSGLARGGSGDLLSGLIAGLAATGVSDINAAIAGVHILSEAAEITRAELGADAMSVSEIASYIPKAFRAVRGDFDVKPPA